MLGGLDDDKAELRHVSFKNRRLIAEYARFLPVAYAFIVPGVCASNRPLTPLPVGKAIGAMPSLSRFDGPSVFGAMARAPAVGIVGARRR